MLSNSSSPIYTRRMASKQSTVDFVVEQISGAGRISAKKMFGEYGLYCDGKLFGLVCDDQLFIKPTMSGRSFLGGEPAEAPPYPGAKAYFVISGDAWDDAERLTRLVRLTTSELPAPKKKADARGVMRRTRRSRVSALSRCGSIATIWPTPTK